MRNGDFVPTRLQAQQDAANLVLQCKLRSNPENAVGILSMAEYVNVSSAKRKPCFSLFSKVEVLATMTQESPKLFMKLHQVQPKVI